MLYRCSIIKLMMDWIKRNKLASVLILVVLFFLYKLYFPPRLLYQTASLGVPTADMVSLKSTSERGIGGLPSSEAPPTTTTNRLVVQESNLSLVVKNVRQSVDNIIDKAKSLGGYMVSSSLSQPEEAPFASVVLRVPAKDLKASLEYFRGQSVKVSSENLWGTDVTDEYTDIDARLTTLNKTKAKFEEIMTRATQIQDILQVQRELISLQDQIDSLKGRQLYLEKTAELARITLYLSTDEFALPYAPATPFRPAVIFKYAVRSLVGTLRGIVKALVWIGVYSVIWLPILLVIYFVRKARNRKRE